MEAIGGTREDVRYEGRWGLWINNGVAYRVGLSQRKKCNGWGD